MEISPGTRFRDLAEALAQHPLQPRATQRFQRMPGQEQRHQIIPRELQHGKLMHLLRVKVAVLDRMVFQRQPSWSRMKLMSRWIVFGVTSISAASVEQFGKRPRG
jgi:hypothetical protein